MAGIWIRSQDKKRLVYCDNFCVVTPTDEYITPVNEMHKWVIRGLLTTLGIYSSEEKAMKVMNDIQEHINNFIVSDIQSNLTPRSYGWEYNNISKNKYILQMPADEDVII